MSQKNLSGLATFSKTHRRTQWIHSWIALGLRNLKKLVPCELNTQILSCGHFSGQNLRKILKPSWCHLSLQPNYSKSREGSTSHFPFNRITLEQRRLYESVHVSCSITCVFHWSTDSWKKTTEPLNNRKKMSSSMEKFEIFGIVCSALGDLKRMLVQSKTRTATPLAS